LIILPNITADKAFEDFHYYRKFYVVVASGTNLSVSHMETDHSWLTWNNKTLMLTGVPSNKDVGTARVHIWVIGEAGERDDLYFNITVDNIDPKIATGDVTYARVDHEYLVNYTSDELDGNITWSLTTNAKFLTMNASTGVLSGIPTISDEGVYDVKVLVEDGNGGSDATNFVLLVDTEFALPEMVRIVSPSPGSYVRNKVMINLTINETWNTVETIGYRVDGQSWTFVTGQGPLYSTLTIIYALKPGPHTVEVKARSTLDHWSYSSVTFYVVNTPPTLDLTSPLDGAFLKGNVTVRGRVADPDEVVDNVNVFVNGARMPAAFPKSDGNWETTIDLDQFPPGTISIEAVARDNWGGVANKEIRITRMASAPSPMVRILTPAHGSIIGENYSIVISVEYTEPTELRLKIGGLCPDIELNVTRGNWSFTGHDCTSFPYYSAFAVKAKVTDRWNQSSEDIIVLIHKGNLTDEMHKTPKTAKSSSFVWPSIALSFAQGYGLTAFIVFSVLTGIHYHFHRKKAKGRAADLKGLPIESPTKGRSVALRGYWTQNRAWTYFVCICLLIVSIFSCSAIENVGQTTPTQPMQNDEPIIETATYWNVRTFTDKYDNLYVFWETYAGTDDYGYYGYPGSGPTWEGINLRTLHFSKFSDDNAILVDDKILFPPGVVYSPDKDVLPAHGAEKQWSYDDVSVWVNSTGDIHLTSDSYWRFDGLGNMVERGRAYSNGMYHRGDIIEVDGESRIVNASGGFNIGQDVAYLPGDRHIVVDTNGIGPRMLTLDPDKTGLHGNVLRVLYHEPTDRLFVVLDDSGRVCYGEYARQEFALLSKGCSPYLEFKRSMPEPFINIDRDGTVHYLVPTLYQFVEQNDGFIQDTSRPEPGLLYLNTKDDFDRFKVIPWDVNHMQVVGARVDPAGNLDIVYKAGYTYDEKYSIELFYKRIPMGERNDPREQGTRMTPNNDVVVRRPPHRSDCGDIILLVTTPATIAYYVKRQGGRFRKDGPERNV
jgi:hypothetical protein